jgi:serpin B
MRFLTLILIAFIVLCGCLNSSSKKLADDSGATEEGVERVVKANNQFAFELYDELSKEHENVFFSPYSIDVALTMTYEGANGKTKEEIGRALHIPTDDMLRRSSYAKLYNILNNKSNSYILKTANALWIQRDFRILDSYKEVISKYYCGKVENIDFKNNPDKAREIINNWVKKETEGKIRELIPKNGVNDMTRLVITNAIYFKGTWEREFDKDKTHDEDFWINKDKKVKVKMMTTRGVFNYAEDAKFQVLELPYKGDDIAMLVFLPKDINPNVSLSIDEFYSLKDNLKEEEIEVFIPKFKMEMGYNLNRPLYNLGIREAFSYDADFSKIDGKKDLFIQNVFHKAFIEVNEEGTEAAAATAVVVGLKSAPPKEYKIFKANHPFIFFIVDKRTDLILFMGKIVNPEVIS